MICQNKKKIGLIAALMLLMLSFALGILLQPAAEYPELQTTYYKVVAEPSNSAMGSVTVTGEHTDGNGMYLGKTDVFLTATVSNSKYYQFDGWSTPDGFITGSEQMPELKISIVTDQGPGYEFQYTALFSMKKYSITYEYPGWQIFDTGFTPPTVHTYGTDTPLPNANADDRNDFVGWVVNGDENTVYPPGSSLGGNSFTTDIVLIPKFEPKKVQVTCQDIIKDTNCFLSTAPDHIKFWSHYGAQNVSGEDIDIATYRGYYYVSCTTLNSVQLNTDVNLVKRFYSPKTYQIIYKNCTPLSSSPTTHTYGEDSYIFAPVKNGYRFLGWTIENWSAEKYPNLGKTFDYSETSPALVIRGTDFDSSTWALDTWETAGNEEDAIVLVARWERIEYSVSYTPVTNSSLPAFRYYDEDFVLPDLPDREGYTFLGWKLQGSDEDYKKNFVFPANSSLEQGLVFVSGWKANGVLYPGAEDSSIVMGDSSFTVLYGNPLPDIVPPTRTGYTFIGYFYHAPNGSTKIYYQADGTCAEGVVWDLIDFKPELIAHWQINECKVELDSTLLQYATVTVNGQSYTDAPLLFDYGTDITVLLTFNAGYKLVQWQGSAVPHAASYTHTFRLTDDTLLSGLCAAMEPTPSFTVNYPDEIFEVAGGLPVGNYLLIYGTAETDRVAFSVDSDGLITFADQTTAGSLRAEAYFGKTVQIIRCGDGQATADSAPQEIAVAARPLAPKLNDDINDIQALDNTIQILMNGKGSYVYEFACSATRSQDGLSGLVWGSNALFENLKSGTPYYVYIRVAASATYPHGESFEIKMITLSANYLQSQIDRLMDLKNSADADFVNKLLQDLAEQMKNVQPASDYVDQLEDIYQTALAEIAFARAQDQSAAELKNYFLTLKQSGAYSETVGVPALQGILDAALANIGNSKTESEVQRIVGDAKTDFAAVLISYLYYGDEFLLSCNGIDREYRLAASRVADLSAVSAQISRAVQAGTIVVGGTQMTLAEAVRALQTMDVVGYYNFMLSHKNTAMPKPEGPFEIKLLIPSELRGNTGLLVAYYRQGTEELTVLDTRREGNYLIFTADSVESFVILADHAVNLTGAIIALSATLLCQLVAIVLLLVRRRKFAKEHRSYAAALPLLAMTVRFFPENARNVTILLAALVVLLQIILLWLLLTSDVIFRRKKRVPAPAPVEPQPEEVSVAAEESSADPAAEPYMVALGGGILEEDAYDEAEGYDSLADADMEEAEEIDAPVYEPQTEEMNDAEAAWYGEDFIEPAANPRYSLPEDEWETETSAEEPYYGAEESELSEQSDGYYNSEEEVYTSEGDYSEENAFAVDEYGEDGYSLEEPTDEGGVPLDPPEEEDGYDPMSIFEDTPREDGEEDLPETF